MIGDEAHLYKAKSLTKIMKNLVNAPYRIGTTGTLDEVGTQIDSHRVIWTSKKGHDNKRTYQEEDTIRNKHSVFGSEVSQRVRYDCVKTELSRRD